MSWNVTRCLTEAVNTPAGGKSRDGGLGPPSPNPASAIYEPRGLGRFSSLAPSVLICEVGL